jgi:hypothetical protein
MVEIVTYLEMTGPGELRPGRPVDEVTLDRIDGTSELIRQVHVGIGTPYAWPSTIRSDEGWAQWLSQSLRQYWLVKHGIGIAGIADMEPPGGEVEITTFAQRTPPGNTAR